MARYIDPTKAPSLEVRLLRMKAHESFDRIWQNQRLTHMSRSRAYYWLAGELGIPEPEAHMGIMRDADLLYEVINLCDDFMGLPTAADDFPDDL